ncbi:ABC transporter permease [Roseomonas marmotae]|uniref:ABC transporter permease n=1 Tax=Roseomonas marmotae TaxID=2768161 RepID=A0ABS3KHY0_9PROT|nr:ABC transporter permease [Roseomonas marmotae]MBO1077037.1 ABC transporter permease [Roseomonas marmotae]QTI78433.1 ABC transporter permease [Roseomonas marmotae]
MGRLLLRRLLAAIVTLLVVSVLVFALQRLLPGDPAVALAGEEQNPQVIAFLRAKYQFDQPLPVQYWAWLKAFLQGDLGISVRTQLPIGRMVLEKLPVTFELAFLSMLLAVALGIPLGVLAALRRGSLADYLVSVVGLAGLSIPSFWLGIMLILAFSVSLGLLPSGGYVPFFEDPVANLRTMVMPAVVLGTASAAILMRHTRSSMLTVLKQDFVRTARAKGLRERIVVVRHALRNGLIPVVTLGTLQFGQLLSGAVLTEQVFGIPGFGKMIVDGVFSRDYAVVQAVVMCSAAFFLLMTLLADLLYMALNPRLRA